jgi:hypothetical protein
VNEIKKGVFITTTEMQTARSVDTVMTKDSFAEGTNQFILFELMWNCRIGVLDKHQVPRSNFWRYLTKPFFFNLELGLIERSSKLYR